MSETSTQFANVLECYRPYLRLVGQLMIDRRLQSKVDLSGLVQATLVEALPVQDRWKTWDDASRLAWLRTTFSHNLLDEARKFHADKRAVQNERSLEVLLEESSLRVTRWLALEQSTPSQKLARDEQLQALARALGRLPTDQARALELHYLKGCSLAETSAVMERSFQAVVGLVYRGVKRLRELLSDELPT